MNLIAAIILIGGLNTDVSIRPTIVKGEDVLLAQELQEAIPRKEGWNPRYRVERVECELLTPAKLSDDRVYQYVIHFIDDEATDPYRRRWQMGSIVFASTPAGFVELAKGEPFIDPKARLREHFRLTPFSLTYPWRKRPK